MSEPVERPLLPEWGIHLRNLIDRVVPVVKDHHAEIDQLKLKLARLEQTVAQQATTIQKQNQDIAVMRAMSMGTGPTTTETGG